MNLYSNLSGGCSYFLIYQVDHFLSIQPGIYSVFVYSKFHTVPFAHLYIAFIFIRLNEPASAIRFINAAGIKSRRSYFCLPAIYFSTFYGAMKKDAAVPIGFLLKVYGEDEVLVCFICC